MHGCIEFKINIANGIQNIIHDVHFLPSLIIEYT